LIVGNYANLDWPMIKSSQNTADPLNIKVTVTDPSTAAIVQHTTLEKGKFGFTSAAPGEHLICVSAESASGSQSRLLRFDLFIDMGEQAADYVELAKVEHLSAIEIEVRKLNDKLKQIRQEQEFQSTREILFRDTSESTNARVMWWAIAECAILLAVGAWQFMVMRKFFKSKKMA
jgi:p24 family protein alpha